MQAPDRCVASADRSGANLKAMQHLIEIFAILLSLPAHGVTNQGHQFLCVGGFGKLISRSSRFLPENITCEGRTVDEIGV